MFKTNYLAFCNQIDNDLVYYIQNSIAPILMMVHKNIHLCWAMLKWACADSLMHVWATLNVTVCCHSIWQWLYGLEKSLIHVHNLCKFRGKKTIIIFFIELSEIVQYSRLIFIASSSFLSFLCIPNFNCSSAPSIGHKSVCLLNCHL